MGEPEAVPRYVAYVRAADTPGSLTAVAGVVSGRGLSLDSLASGEIRDGVAVMILSFTASPRLARLVERTLARLSVVAWVQVLAADDPRVLASGVVRTLPGGRFRPPPDAALSWSGETESGQPLMLVGQLLEVEKVLAAARRSGIDEASYAILPPRA